MEVKFLIYTYTSIGSIVLNDEGSAVNPSSLGCPGTLFLLSCAFKYFLFSSVQPHTQPFIHSILQTVTSKHGYQDGTLRRQSLAHPFHIYFAL